MNESPTGDKFTDGFLNMLKNVGLNYNTRVLLVNPLVSDIDNHNRTQLALDVGRIKVNLRKLLQLQYTDKLSDLIKFSLDTLLISNDENLGLLSITHRTDKDENGQRYGEFMDDIIDTGVSSDIEAKRKVCNVVNDPKTHCTMKDMEQCLPLIYHNHHWTDGLQFYIAQTSRLYTYGNHVKLYIDGVPNQNWLMTKISNLFLKYLRDEGLIDKFDNLSAMGSKFMNLNQAKLDKFKRDNHLSINFHGVISLDDVLLDLAHGLKYMHELSKDSSFNYNYGMGLALILQNDYERFIKYSNQPYVIDLSTFDYMGCIFTIIDNILDEDFTNGAFNTRPDKFSIDLLNHLRLLDPKIKDFWKVYNAKNKDKHGNDSKIINFDKYRH